MLAEVITFVVPPVGCETVGLYVLAAVEPDVSCDADTEVFCEPDTEVFCEVDAVVFDASVCTDVSAEVLADELLCVVTDAESDFDGVVAEVSVPAVVCLSAVGSVCAAVFVPVDSVSDLREVAEECFVVSFGKSVVCVSVDIVSVPLSVVSAVVSAEYAGGSEISG